MMRKNAVQSANQPLSEKHSASVECTTQRKKTPAKGSKMTPLNHQKILKKIEARTLIKRGAIRSIHPRIRQRDDLRIVLDRRGKLSAREKGFVEADDEHIVEAGVDVYPTRGKNERERGRGVRRGRGRRV